MEEECAELGSALVAAKDKNNEGKTGEIKDKKDIKLKIGDPNSAAVKTENQKKEISVNTVTSNLSGKKDDKKQDNKNQLQGLSPLMKNDVIAPEGKIGAPTKNT